MKFIFLFCTKFRVYLIELPLIVLLVLSIVFNERTDSFVKLYPLIIALSLGIVFIALYFFRGIMIKYDEIRDVGLFSERDKVVLTSEKTLILTLMPRRRIKVELFGKDGKAELDWLRDEEPMEIFLYRGKAIGGKATAKRILSYFEVFDGDLNEIVAGDDFSAEYQYVSVSTSNNEKGHEIRIKIEETM